MAKKPTYEELQQRVKDLEKEKSARKKEEKDLLKSKDIFSKLFRACPASLCIVRVEDATFMDVNPVFLQATGLGRNDVIGKPMDQVLSWFSEKEKEVFARELREKGECLDFHTSFEIDEKIFPVSTSGYLIEAEGALCILSVTVGLSTPKLMKALLQKTQEELDNLIKKRTEELSEMNEKLQNEITKREKAMRALRKSERRFRVFLDNLNDGAYEADLSGNFTYLNKTGQIMSGTSKDILGKPYPRVFTDESQKVADKVLQRVMKGESPEFTLNLKNGKTYHFRDNPLRDENGKVVGIFGIVRDVTEHERARVALQRAHDELERKVDERTQELRKINNELEMKNRHLEEASAALNLLLKKREEDRKEFEAKILSNVKQLIFPYTKKLKNDRLDIQQKGLLNIIESNLNEIVSPFLQNLSAIYSDLTPKEIQVAELVKGGKTTKEIAEILTSTERAVEAHRENLRHKLGLKHKKTNLRSHLLTLK